MRELPSTSAATIFPRELLILCGDCRNCVFRGGYVYPWWAIHARFRGTHT